MSFCVSRAHGAGRRQHGNQFGPRHRGGGLYRRHGADKEHAGPSARNCGNAKVEAVLQRSRQCRLVLVDLRRHDGEMRGQLRLAQEP